MQDLNLIYVKSAEIHRFWVKSMDFLMDFKPKYCGFQNLQILAKNSQILAKYLWISGENLWIW